MSKRILVVEDQPDNRQIIRDMLAPTDYEITEVECGEEALGSYSETTTRSAGRKSASRSSRNDLKRAMPLRAERRASGPAAKAYR
jgi:CheY-like chemotaxis protein